MEIFEDHSLKLLNAFGVEARAKYFLQADSREEIIQFIRESTFRGQPLLILNGGSNMLFTKDFDGLVVKINHAGFTLLRNEGDDAVFRVNAGANWDRFVQGTLKLGYAGLENLSMIPGNAGSAPIQNIGAYGVEQKDTFESLEAIDRETGEIRTFTKKECEFGYRNSIFKGPLKNRYIILSVDYRLSKTSKPHLEYGAIRNELEQLGIAGNPSPEQVAQAVCNIRSSKLPDPEELGNAGSFFKNPVINNSEFEKLQKTYPGIPAWPLEDGTVKIAAGWLIDQLGWKGTRRGDAGVCKTQALVLVNYGKASGSEIHNLAMDIQKSVIKKYGITLEPEVNII